VNECKPLHADSIRLLADRGANLHLVGQRGSGNTIPPLLCHAVQAMPLAAGAPPREPDPTGARQLAAVRALLRLGAGTRPPAPPFATLLIPRSRQNIREPLIYVDDRFFSSSV